MQRKPASKGSGTYSPRDVEGAIDLDMRPLLRVDEVAYLLGVPRAMLYRWQSLSSPGAPQGPRAFRVGAVSPLHTGRRPELHRTAAAQRLVTSRCCPAAMNPKAPCPAEVRLRYGVTPEDAGPGLVPACAPRRRTTGRTSASAAGASPSAGGGPARPSPNTAPTGARSSLSCSPPRHRNGGCSTRRPRPSPRNAAHHLWTPTRQPSMRN